MHLLSEGYHTQYIGAYIQSYSTNVCTTPHAREKKRKKEKEEKEFLYGTCTLLEYMHMWTDPTGRPNSTFSMPLIPPSPHPLIHPSSATPLLPFKLLHPFIAHIPHLPLVTLGTGPSMAINAISSSYYHSTCTAI